MAKQSIQSRIDHSNSRVGFGTSERVHQLNGKVNEATSDQAPGEEMVQVNDLYAGGGPPPELDSEHDQHQTGG
jgi:hypothetical protein